MVTVMTNGKRNVTILRVGRMEFLFSYQTLVAFDNNVQTFKTGEKFSATTSRHVTQWLDGRKAIEIPASEWRDWEETLSAKFAKAIPEFK